MSHPGILKMLLISIVFMEVFAGRGLAFRCGTELVSIGDTREQVRYICGEPQSVEAWTEERPRLYPRYPYDDLSKYDRRYSRQYEYRYPFPPVEIVRVEEWVYNLGPNRLIRYLRFENGRLESIDTGDYGY